MPSASRIKEMAADPELDARERKRLDKITQLNAVQSPLLRLPAEIRNLVYHHVFCDEIYRLNEDDWRSNSAVIIDTLNIDTDALKKPCLDLLLASRQIYYESALLPYKLTVFNFGISFNIDWDGEYKDKAIKIFLGNRSTAQVDALGKIKMFLFVEEDYRLEKKEGNGAYWAAELAGIDLGS